MATTKVVIRTNRINNNGQTPVCIRYTHYQRSILFAVGQMVDPQHWDAAGFVKRTVRGYSNINTLIERKKRMIDDIRIELQLSEIDPTIQKVKEEYDKKYVKPKLIVKVSQNVVDHWDMFVTYQTNVNNIAPGTIRQYRAGKNRIQLFEKENKVKITFDKMNSDFYDSFIYHLYSVKNCSPNSVGNQIKYMKAFMNWAVNKQKLTNNMAYAKSGVIDHLNPEQIDHQ